VSRERIEDLVAEFVERREAGEALQVDAFVAGYPELERELRQALERLQSTEALFPAAAHSAQEIGPYRVLGELGRGGMAKVLRVEHRERPREELALKLLNPVAVLNARALSRFEREAEVLRQLEHDGIVGVRDVGTTDGMPYLVMDLIEGNSLATVIEEARRARAGAPHTPPSDCLALPGSESAFRRVARTLRALAEAVHVAHAAGVLHRDIKPGNVLLRPDGRPVLVDFGLVRDEESSSLTHTGDLIGTPRYMAPEQARGDRADERTDVYGLGAVLYELITLQPPHAGDDPLLVLRDVEQRPIPSARKLDRRIPRDLHTILARCLAHVPAYRYASAADLARDLDAFIAGEAIQASAPGLVERSRDLWRFHRRSLVMTAAAASVLAIALIAQRTIEASNAERNAAPIVLEAKRLAAEALLTDDPAELRRQGRRILDALPDDPYGAWLVAAADGQMDFASADPLVSALIRGERLLADDDYAGAIAAFEDAAKLDPTSTLPLLQMARVATRREDDDLALRELLAAARLVPESALVRQRLAYTYAKLRQYDEALVEARQAVALEPTSARHLLLSSTLIQLRNANPRESQPEQIVEGIAAAEEALRTCDGTPGRQLLDVLAMWYSADKQRDRARAMWQRILEQDPNDVKAQYDIALSYDFEDMLAEAAQGYERVLELDPDYARAAVGLSFILAGAQRATCERCEAYFEENPDVLDASRAEELATHALTVTRGEDDKINYYVHEIARLLVPSNQILKALESLLDDVDSERGIVRLHRLRRQLRALDQ